MTFFVQEPHPPSPQNFAQSSHVMALFMPFQIALVRLNRRVAVADIAILYGKKLAAAKFARPPGILDGPPVSEAEQHDPLFLLHNHRTERMLSFEIDDGPATGCLSLNQNEQYRRKKRLELTTVFTRAH